MIPRLRGLVEEEQAIPQSPSNEALLRIAKGIYDFLEETQGRIAVTPVEKPRR